MTNEQIKAYEDKLKPCPFCGKEADLNEGQTGHFYVTCPNYFCNVMAMTNTFETPTEAIKVWNKRGGERND